MDRNTENTITTRNGIHFQFIQSWV